MKDYQAKSTLALAVRAILWGMPLSVVSIATTSAYAANVYQISISSTTLDQALKQLAIQTGSTISYDSATLSKIKSASLKGNYSVETALDVLLKPHAFEAVKVANAGYSIQAKATVAAIEPKVVQLEAIHTKANTTELNQNSETGAAQLPTIHLSADKGQNLTTEGSGSYTAKATTASTGLALTLKETPQLVSVITRQQMEDQNLTQLTDVVSQAAGLT
uniref:STN domain-containing protein n=1 Tax=Acinetobacter gyllenbergii TaxID=134534 RepID=UPI00241CADA6